MNLLNAVCSGDPANVRKALPFFFGSSQLDDALLAAVELGDPEIAELLVKAGANPDVRTKPKEAPALSQPGPPPEFAEEIEAERQALLAELRKKRDEYDDYRERLTLHFDRAGADAEQRTALSVACQSAFSLVERSLIGGVAAIQDQSTRLLAKAQASQLRLIDTLLAAGADPNARDSAGRTACIAAASHKGLGIWVVVPDDEIHYPIGPTDPQPVIARLLAAGADVNACDNGGHTAILNAASTHASVAIIRLLLDAGADVNAQNSHGYSALMYAATSGNTALVRVLLDAGADVDIRDENRFTPLHHIVGTLSPDGFASAIESVRMLIEASADVNAAAALDRTPLHLAAANRYAPPDVVRALLDAGASSSATDELGTTPYDLAVRRNNRDVIPVLARAIGR